MLYLVAYDLLVDQSEAHYQDVIYALKQHGTAVEIQRSVWFLISSHSAADIRAGIQGQLSRGDKLFVSQLESVNWSSYNLDRTARQWMANAGLG